MRTFRSKLDKALAAIAPSAVAHHAIVESTSGMSMDRHLLHVDADVGPMWDWMEENGGDWRDLAKAVAASWPALHEQLQDWQSQLYSRVTGGGLDDRGDSDYSDDLDQIAARAIKSAGLLFKEMADNLAGGYRAAMRGDQSSLEFSIEELGYVPDRMKALVAEIKPDSSDWPHGWVDYELMSEICARLMDASRYLAGVLQVAMKAVPQLAESSDAVSEARSGARPTEFSGMDIDGYALADWMEEHGGTGSDIADLIWWQHYDICDRLRAIGMGLIRKYREHYGLEPNQVLPWGALGDAAYAAINSGNEMGTLLRNLVDWYEKIASTEDDGDGAGKPIGTHAYGVIRRLSNQMTSKIDDLTRIADEANGPLADEDYEAATQVAQIYEQTRAWLFALVDAGRRVHHQAIPFVSKH